MTDTWTAQIAELGYTVPKQVFYRGPFDLLYMHDSGSDGERYAYLPVTNGNPPHWLPVWQCMLPDTQPGDIIDPFFEGQATSNRDTNTEILGKTLWSYNSGETVGIDHIGEENGENVDLAMHHIKVLKGGLYRVPDNMPANRASFVTLCLSANCTDLVTQPLIVNIDQDYGRLFVKHWRKRP